MRVDEILIVDDERTVREGLKALLTGEGYAVRTARDGEQALQEIGVRRPSLVLLDVMMPKMNGFRCCEMIRRSDALLPVIFLTAKDSEADQVRGLGLGGDDYVSKAAAESVLLARIARVFERERVKVAPRREEAAAGDIIRLGKVLVDMRNLTVQEDGRQISLLTRTEADLLRLMFTHRNERFLADDLITALRGSGFVCEDTMIYVHVSNLRRKLGSAAPMIVNRRGVGYGIA